MRPQLVFVPHYIGSLKYFEHLIPYLKNKYEVFFLFLPKIKEAKQQVMINYCQQQGYRYYLMKKIPKFKLANQIPFYYQLISFFNYRKELVKIFKNSNIKKVVTALDKNIYHDYLFYKTSKLKIESLTLQWALTLAGEVAVHKNIRFFLNHGYHLLINWLFSLKTNYLKILGGGNEDKFGVINKQAYNLFKSAGIDEKKMSVVGSLDFGITEKIFNKLNQDPELKKRVLKKYHINPHKKNVIIFSSPFNVKDLKLLNNKEQYDYYERIVKNLREVLNFSECDILFKIHPVEDLSLYQPLEKYNVKLYDLKAVNQELIYFADLYIAHYSTTNFIPLALGKEAIFINFIKIKSAELGKKFFAIKKFVTDEVEFKKLLLDFKNNNLERQYHLTDEVFTEDSLNKIINWIG